MITRFERFEFKYILTRTQAQALLSELSSLLPSDSYSGLAGYWINSLYYDSPELGFFWAKIDGHRFRQKLRIRTYEPLLAEHEAPAKVAVEIKQRLGKVVEKRRIFLELAQAQALCRGEALPASSDPWEQQVSQEILHMVRSLSLQPVCLVRYHRQALVGTAAEPDLRITFDRELSCRSQALETHSARAGMPYFLAPEYCVLEVKVSQSMPLWLQERLHSHHCQLHRISKYCVALAQEKEIPVRELVTSTDLPPSNERKAAS